MGMQTVAECTENDAVFDRIAIIGVAFALGYPVGRPRPLTELVAELVHNRVAAHGQPRGRSTGYAGHAWMVTRLAPDQCAGVGDKVASVMRLIFPTLYRGVA